MTLIGIIMGLKFRVNDFLITQFCINHIFAMNTCATKKINEYKSLGPFLHGSHLWGKVAVEHLTLGPPFNMVGKFILFGLLLSAPLDITGLKCYQGTNTQGGGPAPLITCPAGANRACTISDSK